MVAEARENDRRADEGFRLLVESVRDYAIFMLDPTGHVATWNFGVDPIGFAPTYSDYVELLEPEDRLVAQELVSRCVDTGEPYEFEHRVTRTDGTERWVQARGRAITDETGRVVKLQGTAQDVTELRHAAEAREQLAAL